ncbi:kinase-like domain-containing protein [Phyllosticta citrichinensis]|uniref:Kinase-like domain-containing protein n=1 Tax=Phyllosticta citrichinensis TaxID=1130410 RepID=A0ABR1Y167_9PEZI
MSDPESRGRIIRFWYPGDPDNRIVKHGVTTGGDYFIGYVDETTVLKFPHFKGKAQSMEDLQVERQIYERVGKHPRIIEYKGWHEDGLLLEYAPNKSLNCFLADNPTLSKRERLRIAKETAEGVDFVHKNNVLLRDIAVRNILLDADLHVKLCDLTGQLLGDDGQVIAKGHGWEDFDAMKPRADTQYADIVTDIFALGTTVYKIMVNQGPFPDTHDDQELKQRFEQRRFPELDERLGGKVVWGCWDSLYKSAGDVAKDLEKLEQASLE